MEGSSTDRDTPVVLLCERPDVNLLNKLLANGNLGESEAEKVTELVLNDLPIVVDDGCQAFKGVLLHTRIRFLGHQDKVGRDLFEVEFVTLGPRFLTAVFDRLGEC
jgi:hypothetical protein